MKVSQNESQQTATSHVVLICIVIIKR